MAFAPLQIGLCCFIPASFKNIAEEKITSFDVYPYNINLNPLSLKSAFLSDSGSLSFLTKHEFDFNNLYYEGIGRNAFRKEKENILGVKFWSSKTLPLVGALEKLETNPNQEITAEIDVAKLGTLESKRLHQLILLNFPQIDIQINYNAEILSRRTVLKIALKNKENMSERVNISAQIEQLIQDLCNKEREAEADLKPIIDKIIEKKTPLITHNGFIDLMHVELS